MWRRWRARSSTSPTTCSSWRSARWHGRCPSPGWPSTASGSRPWVRPSTCAITCWLRWGARPPLTFTFVGGGYAGIEAFAELEDMAHYAIEHYYPRLSAADMRWVLVEAPGRVLPGG